MPPLITVGSILAEIKIFEIIGTNTNKIRIWGTFKIGIPVFKAPPRFRNYGKSKGIIDVQGTAIKKIYIVSSFSVYKT